MASVDTVGVSEGQRQGAREVEQTRTLTHLLLLMLRVENNLRTSSPVPLFSLTTKGSLHQEI